LILRDEGSTGELTQLRKHVPEVLMHVEGRSQSFHGYSIHDIVKQLETDLDSGLTAEEVAHRYETYGRNELPVKPGKPAWLRFLLQFHQPLLYILLLAGR
jgi:cation-transporting ATPase F